MNSISTDISGKIDAENLSILRNLNAVAEDLGVRYFLVGAFARDVLFTHIHGIQTPRATRDIDICIEVASWDEFRRFSSELVERGFLSATKISHRFTAKKFAAGVDIVPYGEIGDGAKRISWPPGHEVIMSILGFEEAYQSALTVRFSNEPPLEIPIPSVPALAFLKIISWDDAYPQRSRDAQDLLFILENCDATGIETELYGSHTALLTEEEFDLRLASVRMLGRDMARIAGPETVKKVEEVLTRETDESQEFRMVSDMVRGNPFHGSMFESSLLLMKKLLQGVQEGQSGTGFEL